MCLQLEIAYIHQKQLLQSSVGSDDLYGLFQMDNIQCTDCSIELVGNTVTGYKLKFGKMRKVRV